MLCAESEHEMATTLEKAVCMLNFTLADISNMLDSQRHANQQALDRILNLAHLPVHTSAAKRRKVSSGYFPASFDVTEGVSGIAYDAQPDSRKRRTKSQRKPLVDKNLASVFGSSDVLASGLKAKVGADREGAIVQRRDDEEPVQPKEREGKENVPVPAPELDLSSAPVMTRARAKVLQNGGEHRVVAGAEGPPLKKPRARRRKSGTKKDENGGIADSTAGHITLLEQSGMPSQDRRETLGHEGLRRVESVSPAVGNVSHGKFEEVYADCCAGDEGSEKAMQVENKASISVHHAVQNICGMSPSKKSRSTMKSTRLYSTSPAEADDGRDCSRAGLSAVLAVGNAEDIEESEAHGLESHYALSQPGAFGSPTFKCSGEDAADRIVGLQSNGLVSIEKSPAKLSLTPVVPVEARTSLDSESPHLRRDNEVELSRRTTQRDRRGSAERGGHATISHQEEVIVREATGSGNQHSRLEDQHVLQRSEPKCKTLLSGSLLQSGIVERPDRGRGLTANFICTHFRDNSLEKRETLVDAIGAQLEQVRNSETRRDTLLLVDAHLMEERDASGAQDANLHLSATKQVITGGVEARRETQLILDAYSRELEGSGTAVDAAEGHAPQVHSCPKLLRKTELILDASHSAEEPEEREAVADVIGASRDVQVRSPTTILLRKTQLIFDVHSTEQQERKETAMDATGPEAVDVLPSGTTQGRKEVQEARQEEVLQVQRFARSIPFGHGDRGEVDERLLPASQQVKVVEFGGGAGDGGDTGSSVKRPQISGNSETRVSIFGSLEFKSKEESRFVEPSEAKHTREAVLDCVAPESLQEVHNEISGGGKQIAQTLALAVSLSASGSRSEGAGDDCYQARQTDLSHVIGVQYQGKDAKDDMESADVGAREEKVAANSTQVGRSCAIRLGQFANLSASEMLARVSDSSHKQHRQSQLESPGHQSDGDERQGNQCFLVDHREHSGTDVHSFSTMFATTLATDESSQGGQHKVKMANVLPGNWNDGSKVKFSSSGKDLLVLDQEKLGESQREVDELEEACAKLVCYSGAEEKAASDRLALPLRTSPKADRSSGFNSNRGVVSFRSGSGVMANTTSLSSHQELEVRVGSEVGSATNWKPHPLSSRGAVPIVPDEEDPQEEEFASASDEKRNPAGGRCSAPLDHDGKYSQEESGSVTDWEPHRPDDRDCLPTDPVEEYSQEESALVASFMSPKIVEACRQVVENVCKASADRERRARNESSSQQEPQSGSIIRSIRADPSLRHRLETGLAVLDTAHTPVVNVLQSARSSKVVGSACQGQSSNLVSTMKTFVPVIQQPPPSFLPTAKRDIKVKALAAAEAAKSRQEKLDRERRERKMIKKSDDYRPGSSLEKDIFVEGIGGGGQRESVAASKPDGESLRVEKSSGFSEHSNASKTGLGSLVKPKGGTTTATATATATATKLRIEKKAQKYEEEIKRKEEEMKRKEAKFLAWKQNKEQRAKEERDKKRQRHDDLVKQRKGEEDQSLRAAAAEVLEQKEQKQRRLVEAAPPASERERILLEEIKRQRWASSLNNTEKEQQLVTDSRSLLASSFGDHPGGMKALRVPAVALDKVAQINNATTPSAISYKVPPPVLSFSSSKVMSVHAGRTPGGAFKKSAQNSTQQYQRGAPSATNLAGVKFKGATDSAISHLETPSPRRGAAAEEDLGPVSYEISPYRESSDEEDEDEDEDDHKTRRVQKPIPFWARKGNLTPQLLKQLPLDPDSIFASSKTCSLKEIFGTTGSKKVKDFSKRSDSGDWVKDRVSWKEELHYKINMGYMNKKYP